MNRTRAGTGGKVAIALSLTMLAAGCGASTAAKAAGPIQIAYLSALTGSLSGAGILDEQGVNVAVAYVNSHGGIDGRKLEVTAYNDESEPTQGTLLAGEIAADSSYLAVVGGVNASTGAPEATALNSASVPMVALYGDATQNAIYQKWIFKQGASFDLYSRAFMSFLHNTLHVSKVGILYETGTYGQSFVTTIKNDGSQYGVTTTDAEAAPPGALSATAQVSRIVASGAQIMLLVPATTWSVQLLAWANLGYPIPAIGTPSYAVLAQCEPDQAACEHLTAIITTFNGDDPLARQKPFVDAYEQKYHSSPSLSQAQGWDGIMILAAALKRDDSSRAGVRNALEKISDLQGADGVYTFTATSHDGLAASGIQFVNYGSNGQYTTYK